jgi:LysW-gamma-L-alpha-aminoadipyl-6-phosphate/LysW-L-glutamyl-5-phosphate reductase
MPRYTAAVYGGSGYLGAEVIRRLLQHPHIELAHVYAADHVGQPLAAALPNLEGKTALRFEAVTPGVAPSVDVLLLALPHPVSHQVVAAAWQSKARILDMSGAFRADTPDAYQRAYGEQHPLPHLLREFVYGLPELNRGAIQGARWVSSPGCFATSLELGLIPLARAGWLKGSVQAVAMTGSSGAGISPSPTTHHPSRAHNLRVYRPFSHTHAPEVAGALALAGAPDVRVDFVPVAAPLTRGILATSFARVPASLDAAALERQVRDTWRGERFVLVPEARLPEVVSVAGSNYAEVGIVVGPIDGAERLVTCVSALDNLVKGGAGQAVQNLNLMLGLEESLGLLGAGLYP